MDSDAFKDRRHDMVAKQLQAPGRDISDLAVLEAMRTIPRHAFVPRDQLGAAYDDRPLPIGEDQTISQPFIVAYMTQALALSNNERVLEIGTGCGYQTAILASIAKEVYTVEIVPALSKRAQETLNLLGITNVRFHMGDGHLGWPDEAPFDAIIATCAARTLPTLLTEQLAIEGRLVIPIGKAGRAQSLDLYTKRQAGLERTRLLPVRFVPMTGGHGAVFQ